MIKKTVIITVLGLLCATGFSAQGVCQDATAMFVVYGVMYDIDSVSVVEDDTRDTVTLTLESEAMSPTLFCVVPFRLKEESSGALITTLFIVPPVFIISSSTVKLSPFRIELLSSETVFTSRI